MKASDGIAKAFEKFTSNTKDLEEGIISSTMAGWNGSGYSVELFPDGSYRVLWDNSIGNLYHSPGVIVPIPALSEGDYSQEDEYGETNASAIFGPFFDNAVEELREAFKNDGSDYL